MRRWWQSPERRERAEELMDDPSLDPQLLRKCLSYIRKINSLLSYTRYTLSHLQELTAGWPADRPMRVLDVATGSADVPAALLRWADRRGLRDVRVTALDLHAGVLREASTLVRDPRVTFIRGDASRLPFEKGAFDFAMTSMFLHHLDDEVIVNVFRELDRVSRRGVVAADLVRNWGALFWIRVFSVAANPVVRHDAVASVKQAFTEGEIMGLVSRAGVTYLRYRHHFGHRFVLSGEKEAYDGVG